MSQEIEKPNRLTQFSAYMVSLGFIGLLGQAAYWVFSHYGIYTGSCTALIALGLSLGIFGQAAKKA